MTATSYVTLDNDDLGANKIFRAATASALDTNPVAIAQRGTGAPWLNGIGAIAALTSGSGNWTVPDGVYRIKVTAVGQGGLNRSPGATNGDSTTFHSVTAGGGLFTGGGGTATGGDINIDGHYAPVVGGGGVSVVGGRSAFGGNYGLGGYGGGAGGPTYHAGGGGATAVKIFSVEPGDSLAYSVGGNVFAGNYGIIIIEY